MPPSRAQTSQHCPCPSWGSRSLWAAGTPCLSLSTGHPGPPAGPSSALVSGTLLVPQGWGDPVSIRSVSHRLVALRTPEHLLSQAQGFSSAVHWGFFLPLTQERGTESHRHRHRDRDERQAEIERQTHRETDTKGQKHRDRDRHRETGQAEIEAEIGRGIDTHRHTHRDRDGGQAETQRDRDRVRERDTQRETERGTETETERD